MIKEVSKTILLVISMSSVARADVSAHLSHAVGEDVASLSQYQSGYLATGQGGHGADVGVLSPSNPYEPGNPYEPTNPYQPQPGPGYSNSEYRTLVVGRSVVNERLRLREMAGLGSAYRGWEVRSIRVQARAASTVRATVQLIADGRIIASQLHSGNTVYLAPQSRLVLDSTVRSLQLAINGALVVDQVLIELGRGQATPPPPNYGSRQVDISVYRNLFSNDRVDLGQLVDLRNYRGSRLVRVIVSARAQYNSSLVNLVVNGFNQGQVQFAGGYVQQQTILLNQNLIIGQGADSLVLYTAGNMTIERVTLELSNSY